MAVAVCQRLFINRNFEDRPRQTEPLCSIVKDIRAAALKHFGVLYSSAGRKLKAKKYLTGSFPAGASARSIRSAERVLLARNCLEDGDRAGRRQITAQAKIAYIADLMDICSRFRCKACANIVNKSSPAPSADQCEKIVTGHIGLRTFISIPNAGWKSEAEGLELVGSGARASTPWNRNQTGKHIASRQAGLRIASGELVAHSF